MSFPAEEPTRPATERRSPVVSTNPVATHQRVHLLPSIVIEAVAELVNEGPLRPKVEA